jgi:hypothetical protein
MRTWPVVTGFGAFLVLMFPALSIAAAWDQAPAGSIIMGLAALVIVVRLLRECGASGAALHESLQWHESDNGDSEATQVTERPVTCMPSEPLTPYAKTPLEIGRAAHPGK